MRYGRLASAVPLAILYLYYGTLPLEYRYCRTALRRRGGFTLLCRHRSHLNALVVLALVVFILLLGLHAVRRIDEEIVDESRNDCQESEEERRGQDQDEDEQRVHQRHRVHLALDERFDDRPARRVNSRDVPPARCVRGECGALRVCEGGGAIARGARRRPT